MSDTPLEDTLTFTDWNALRVLVDDHADAALARVLIAEKRGLPSNGAQVAYVQAERLQKKVYAAFCSAGSDGEDRPANPDPETDT